MINFKYKYIIYNLVVKITFISYDIINNFLYLKKINKNNQKDYKIYIIYLNQQIFLNFFNFIMIY